MVAACKEEGALDTALALPLPAASHHGAAFSFGPLGTSQLQHQGAKPVADLSL